MNSEEVLAALGVNRNWTEVSDGFPPPFFIPNIGVYYAFMAGGDWSKSTSIEDIGSLLDHGVQVVLYYGYFGLKDLLTKGCGFYVRAATTLLM